jgi:cell division protein FtsB
VRWRFHGNLLLENLAWTLAAAGAAAVVVVAADRFFALGFFRPWGLAVLAALGAAVAAGLWLRQRPSLLSVAVRVDGELGLKERISTTLALEQSSDPFALAARKEALQAADRIDLKGKFPVRLSRRWLWPAFSWLAVAAVFLFLPTLDVLGHGRQKAADAQQKTQLQQARDKVKQAMEKLDVSIKQLADPSLSAELAKASDAKDALKPDDVKRSAIRKLGELADKIKNDMAPKTEQMKTLGDMLKGLRAPAHSLSPELNRDLAKGDFKAAGDVLRELQKKLEDGKLSKEQQDALSKQLSELAKQLESLADKNKDLQDELEKAGLDKDLANLSEDDLKKALENQGLSKEKIDELMKKAAACKNAAQMCKNLGKCMGACCGAGAGEGEAQELSPAELAKLLDDLSELEACEKAVACGQGCLGEIEGICDGMGQGEWQEGLSLMRSRGSGGPGIGMGPRDTAKDGVTGTEKTRVEGPTKDAPIVASWYFKGPQIKGESQKKFQDVVQAGRDMAAEAINDNEIPRKYEGPVKSYFGDLEKSGKDSNQ